MIMLDFMQSWSMLILYFNQTDFTSCIIHSVEFLEIFPQYKLQVWIDQCICMPKDF
jgi:hypothetical protein